MSTHIYHQNYPYLVYMHTSKTSGKSYIGYTSKTMEKRFNGHLYDVKYGSTYAFHNALRKYGKDNFISNILYVCLTEKDALAAEVELIEAYDTYKSGYNHTSGGRGTPRIKNKKGHSKRSISIIIDNVLYTSKSSAVKQLRLDWSTISEYLKLPTGNILEYAKSKRSIRPIEIDGTQYSSIAEASRKLGIHLVRIREYVDNSLHLKYKNIFEYYETRRKTTPVIVNGSIFNSKIEAQTVLNLTKYQLNLIIS